MIQFPNAKINIGLNILGKRQDGYHELETTFYPINICDSLEIHIDEEFQFCCYPEQPYSTQDNIVFKAWQLFKDKFQIHKNVKIDLIKRIPQGAGLGGGSSDAAFTLKMLYQLFEIVEEKDELQSLAASLGSDCAFFVENKPSYATGRGEMLQHIELDLSEYNIFLIAPNIPISTKEAFSNLKQFSQVNSLWQLVKQPVQQWHKLINNDFEDSLFPYYPVLDEIKQLLYNEGALYASMSGSGSALYGIYNKTSTLQMLQFEQKMNKSVLELLQHYQYLFKPITMFV